MAHRPTKWPYWARYEPDRAKRTIVAALRAHDGNVARAAELLDLSTGSLKRYVERLGLRGELAMIRRDAVARYLARRDDVTPSVAARVVADHARQVDELFGRGHFADYVGERIGCW